MSGIKERTVDITESQLASILSGISQSQLSARRSQEAIQEAREELQRQARRDRAALESQLEAQQSQMHELERDYARKMKRQAQQFNRKLEEQAEETNERFEQVDQRFEHVDRRLNQIESSVQDLRSETHQLVQEARDYTDKRVTELASQIQAKEDHQRKLAESVQALYQQAIGRVKSHPRFEKFVDIDLLNELENEAATGSDQMKSSSFGGAYGSYRNATYKVHTLEQEIQLREQEWLATRQVVRSEVENGLAESKAAATHEQEWALEGGESDLIETRVDHWTNGALTELDGQINEMKDQLSDQRSEDLSLDQLKELAQVATQKRVQVAQALQVAEEQNALSQQRWEFMDAVADSLKDHYTPIKDGYLDEDGRNGYSLLMEGATGDQIAIRVDPSVSESNPSNLANRFSVDYFHPSGRKADVPPSIQQDIQFAFSDVLGEEVILQCQDAKYNHRVRTEVKESAQTLTQSSESQIQTQKHREKLKQRVMKSQPAKQSK